MEFACPNCHIISERYTVDVRKDKPRPEPVSSDYGTGYWSRLGYELNLKIYEWDHWNRTITCGNCGYSHHYYEEQP